MKLANLVGCAAAILAFEAPLTFASSTALIFSSSACAFAGGFGSMKQTSNAKSKQRKRKSDLEDLAPLPVAPIINQHDVGNNELQLDKWGLPPPTEADIFPPLPHDTELIPVSKDDYTLMEIQRVLDGYIPLNLDRFDANGVEKQTWMSEAPMKVRLLHQSPPVLAIDNFLTFEECLDIERVAWPSKKDTQVDGEEPRRRPVQVTSQTFQGAISRRTSTSWFCFFSQLPQLLTKMQYMLGLTLEHMEEPQIVRYETGQEFSWHYDEVPSTLLNNGGQRLATLLVYLNTLPEHAGGGTVFRDLRDANGETLCVQPIQGTALLFFPADANGRPDDRTLHKGDVVAKGFEKRIVQVWTHEETFAARLPPGNLQADARESVNEMARRLGYIQNK
ncbi:hypothetical protein MPSEU_000184500 [Mayamaea pseudoterrestris]|nr:hypothetical protein MPSEU_000184500 [Mayamaea pseudoterrestris]